MPEETVFLVRVLNLERDSGYFHVSSGRFAPGDRCVVNHNGLRLGVVQSALSAGEGIGKQLERMVRSALSASPAQAGTEKSGRQDLRSKVRDKPENKSAVELYPFVIFAA